MKIDINEVRKLNERCAEINAIPFDEIEWTDGNNVIEVTPVVREDWQFVGLCNTTFVELEFWNAVEATA